MTTSTPLRVGIIGAGYIAGVHSAAYRVLPGTFPDRNIVQTAAADSDLTRAEQLRSRWGWERAERDWRCVTRAEDVDIVDICVPNALHAEIALDAFAHGKAVICEKPLAHDSAVAREMCEAAEASRLLAQVCFYYRLWPPIAWARELIAEGRIGPVQHVRAWMLQDYAAAPGHELGWRARRAEAGAGALGDLGSHVIDLVQALCGQITGVCAIARSTLGQPDVDDLASMLVEFATGASGVIEASWALRGHQCDLGFDIVGERGAIRFAWERSNEIEVAETSQDGGASTGFRRVLVGPSQPDVHRFVGVPGQGLGYRDAFTIGLGHFMDAAHGRRRSVAPTFADGLSACKVVAAGVRSARTRAWEPVS